MSQQTSSIGSKDLDEWDFADHPPIQLEAEEESLDSLMDDEFLGGYYNSYRDVRNREVEGYREGDDGGVGAMEVPIWIESTNVRRGRKLAESPVQGYDFSIFKGSGHNFI